MMGRVRTILMAFVPGAVMIQHVAAETLSEGSNITVQIGSILTWASATPVDWRTGILIAVFGFVGSLIAIYGFVGDALLGTEGRKKMVEYQDQIDEWTKELDEMIKSHKPEQEGLIKATGEQINLFRDDMNSERWKMFGIGSLLYAIIGIAIALLLAQNVLDALIIGAGWTSIIGTLGLKQKYTESSYAKNAVLDEAMALIKCLKETTKTEPAAHAPTVKMPTRGGREEAEPQPVPDAFAGFERRMRIAKKL